LANEASVSSIVEPSLARAMPIKIEAKDKTSSWALAQGMREG
jgi:hypothetical protein